MTIERAAWYGRGLTFQFHARDAVGVAEWLYETLGVELDEWQFTILARSWATLSAKADDARKDHGMSHQANEHDQFTAMNATGDKDRDDGLPDVAGYEGPSVPDQAPLINPSAGTQGEAGGGVNPMGAAPVMGNSQTAHSDRQVFPDTSQGYPK